MYENLSVFNHQFTKNGTIQSETQKIFRIRYTIKEFLYFLALLLFFINSG